MGRGMKLLLPFLLLIASPAAAQPSPFIGEYAIAEGPDVGGGLLIRNDGRFRYLLAAGALDERAEGRWETQGDRICLTTEPAPVPPAFEKGTVAAVDGAIPTLFVSWPNGRGIAGVDFVIGFDAGDPIEDYTQADGWTMPEGDTRIPRWIELFESIYDIGAPRFDLSDSDDGKLRVILQPNDIGVVAFDNACLEATDQGAVLHRAGGRLRFVRL